MKAIVTTLIHESTNKQTSESGVVEQLDPEKLVELTVRECLKVLKLDQKHPVSNYHWESIGREVSFFVREHFGVDE